MQMSHMFHSTSMCSGHKFRDREMMSSQNSEEGEEEQSLQQHPQALKAVLEQSGSQSPDSRMVGAYSVCSRPHRVCMVMASQPSDSLWSSASRRAGVAGTASFPLFASLAQSGRSPLILLPGHTCMC